MINRLVLETRLVRHVVTFVAVTSFYFLLIKKMKLNELRLIRQRNSPPPPDETASSNQHDGQSPSWANTSVRRRLHNTGNYYFCPSSSTRTSSLPKTSTPFGLTTATEPMIANVETRLLKKSSRLPRIDGIFKRCLVLLLIYQAINMAQHLMMLLLKCDFAKEYAYLDCFLLGRLELNPRLTDYMRVTYISGTVFLLCWPMYILLEEPEYHFDVLEFLLHDHKCLASTKSRRREDSLGDSTTPRPCPLSERLSSGAVEPASSNDHLKPLLQFHSILTDKPTNADRMIDILLRPNRTREAWLAMSRLLCQFTLGAYFLVLCLTVLVLSMMVPLLLTKAGFMLEHRHCADWIRQHDGQYSFILELPPPEDQQLNPTRDFFLPLRDFNKFNWYSVLRVTYQFLLNVVFYYGSANILISNAALSVITSADLLIYSSQLSAMLRELIHDLQTRASFLGPLRAPPPPSSPSSAANISRVQAFVVDYFDLLKRYGRYASDFSALSVSVWILYSMMISTWIFLPGSFSSANKLEWYTIHVFGTTNTFIIICSFARVRNASCRLYPLIAGAAALDSDCALRKSRWHMIMCYYDPKSIYCFKLLRSVEVSWLFMFKLTAWLLSALLVVSTFYSNYGGDQ